MFEIQFSTKNINFSSLFNKSLEISIQHSFNISDIATRIRRHSLKLIITC